jgi:hypothetical protein
MSEDQDWRLRIDFEWPGDLEGLLWRVPRDVDGLARDVREKLGPDVVLTHDGSRFFAYAPSESALRRARAAIERACSEEQRTASIRMSHWDAGLGSWRQTDPPLTGAEQAELAERERTADQPAGTGDAKPETRTVVCDAGRLIRSEFEQDLVSYAAGLGLSCVTVEHPHLLTTQIAFTLTGPTSTIDEFASYLKGAARHTIRMSESLVSGI